MSSIPLDLCVPTGGPNAHLFFRLYFRSMQRYCNVDNVRLHLIDYDCSEEQLRSVREVIGSTSVDIVKTPVSPMYSEGNLMSGQSAMWDWIVRDVGEMEWVGISHVDIHFLKDWITDAVNHVATDVGAVGQHLCAMLINRKAYQQSNCKFRNLSPFVACPIDDGTGHYKLRHADDARVGAGAVKIRGFDVGELLELEMRALQWKVIPFAEAPYHGGYYHHIGGAVVDSYGPRMGEFRDRVNAMIEANGY